MRATQKRINLTVEEEIFNTINKMAKTQQTSVAKVCHELIAQALGLREDSDFSKADEDQLVLNNYENKKGTTWAPVEINL